MWLCECGRWNWEGSLVPAQGVRGWLTVWVLDCQTGELHWIGAEYSKASPYLLENILFSWYSKWQKSLDLLTCPLFSKKAYFLFLIVPLFKLVFMMMRASEFNFTENKEVKNYRLLWLCDPRTWTFMKHVKYYKTWKKKPHTDNIFSLFWFSACFFTL